MRLIKNCRVCSRPAEIVHSFFIGTSHVNQYKCGHTFAEEIEQSSDLEYQSVDRTKRARAYQQDGIKFIIESGFNCIIADQQRLGKTPQALLALANKYKERTPCLILVRSANLWQWIREYKVWCDSLPLGVFPITSSKAFIPPGFSAYILSQDTLGSEGTCVCGHAIRKHDSDGLGKCRAKNCNCTLAESNEDGMVKKLLDFGFKLVIADECHFFKNSSSKRSKALIQFLHEISKEEITYTLPFTCFNCKHTWDEIVTVQVTAQSNRVSKTAYCPSCNAYNQHTAHKEKIQKDRKCGAILLSGTPIKNRADEYFIPLNIVAPERFSSQQRFKTEWLSDDGKRIRGYKLDDFKRLIKPYFLRREKEDVYTDLPKLNRMFTVIDIQDEHLKKLYNQQLDKIEAQMASRSNFTFFDTIGELAILRQICGLAKVEFTANYLDVAMDEEENSKYAIGIHHHSVRDLLALKLSHLGVLKLSGEDSAERKDYVMRHFETSQERNLIINMLAGGVGMDFHYVNNILILERQWSSADEEQFEYRFYNPDKSIKTAATDIEYIVAKGTVDEFFYDLVEEKRQIFGETISTNWDLKEDKDSFRRLVERTVSSRL